MERNFNECSHIKPGSYIASASAREINQNLFDWFGDYKRQNAAVGFECIARPRAGEAYTVLGLS